MLAGKGHGHVSWQGSWSYWLTGVMVRLFSEPVIECHSIMTTCCVSVKVILLVFGYAAFKVSKKAISSNYLFKYFRTTTARTA